jgi:hypothetical protein
MAASAAIDATYSQNDTTQATQVARGTITLSGNYGTAGSHGDPLSFGLYGIQSHTLIRVFIYEAPAAGTAPTGFQWGFAPGTTIANGKLTCFTGTTEYTQASAYSSGQKAAVLKFEAVFAPFL